MKRFEIATSMMVSLLAGCLDATTGAAGPQAAVKLPLAVSEIDLGFISADKPASVILSLTDPIPGREVDHWKTSCDCMTVRSKPLTDGRSGTVLQVELDESYEAAAGMYRIDVVGFDRAGSAVASFVVQFVTVAANPESD